MKETDSKDWRQKYSDAVRIFELEERHYRAQQQSLSRLLGRLCLLAQGQSSQADAELRRLKDLLTQDHTDPDALDNISHAIAQAVRELEQQTASAAAAAPDNTAPAAAAAAAADHDAQIHDTLSRLLQELRRDPALLASADALQSALTQQTQTGLWPTLLERLGSLVLQRIRNLEAARSELAALLDHLVQSLDEIARFAAGDADDLAAQARRRDEFSSQVAGEVQALSLSLDDNGTLAELRQQLRARLDSIGSRLLDFRRREAAVLGEAQARSTRMHAQIAELEQRAQLLQERLQQEKRAATLDPLTRVPNRLAWDERLADELQRWQHFAQPACIAVWDIDHFKRINDSHGHAAGDKALKYVADCLGRNLRSMDFLARYGGEEFVMILPGSSLDDGLALAERIRDAVGNIALHIGGVRQPITISCGITALVSGDTAAAVFERADRALYRAKAEGRNRVAASAADDPASQPPRT